MYIFVMSMKAKYCLPLRGVFFLLKGSRKKESELMGQDLGKTSPDTMSPSEKHFVKLLNTQQLWHLK